MLPDIDFLLYKQSDTGLIPELLHYYFMRVFELRMGSVGYVGVSAVIRFQVIPFKEYLESGFQLCHPFFDKIGFSVFQLNEDDNPFIRVQQAVAHTDLIAVGIFSLDVVIYRYESNGSAGTVVDHGVPAVFVSVDDGIGILLAAFMLLGAIVDAKAFVSARRFCMVKGTEEINHLPLGPSDGRKDYSTPGVQH